MKDCVLIKGTQYGLTVWLDDAATYEELYSYLQVKLQAGRTFFGNNKVHLSITGKSLSSTQTDALTDLFLKETDLQIISVVLGKKDYKELKSQLFEAYSDEFSQAKLSDELSSLEDKNRKLQEEILQLKKQLENNHNTDYTIEKVKDQELEDMVVFHYSTLRSGQQIITDRHVIIIGDVNHGARIQTNKNVLVFGRLKGVVQAGDPATNKGYVLALDMQPVQIRIGDVYGRASDSVKEKTTPMNPKIAYVEKDRIVIEAIHNRLYKYLKI